MTQEVFHKLITLAFELDMVSDQERADTIQQLGSLVLQSVALRAVQTIPESEQESIKEKFALLSNTQDFLQAFSELFPDVDIWIQDEVRKLHQDFSTQE